MSDHYALEFMRFLQGQGIRVPEDVQIIGFDDTLASRESVPALTTIHQDAALRARTAIRRLEALRDGTPCDAGIVLPVELVERESLLATAESEGLDRREVLFAHKPAAVTQEDRREAIAALLRISEDSLTPEAINATLTGCGIRARAEEKADGSLRVVFPRTAGVPAEFDQIRKIILDILPCHLEVEFYFRYLTWAECEAAEYTWDEVETAQHTWESFQLAVPPEE